MSLYHNFFERIYVINLETRPERMEHFNENFCPKVNIDPSKVIRFNAIRNHNDGAIGCALSHLSIIEECLKDKIDNVLIFEDDVDFVHGTNEDLLNTLTDAKIHNWDMLYLGGIISNLTKIEKVTNNLYKVKNICGAHAIAINNTIFEKISSETKNFNIKKNVNLLKCPTKEVIDHYYSFDLFYKNNVFFNPNYYLAQIRSPSDIKMYRSIKYKKFKKRWINLMNELNGEKQNETIS